MSAQVHFARQPSLFINLELFPPTLIQKQQYSTKSFSSEARYSFQQSIIAELNNILKFLKTAKSTAPVTIPLNINTRVSTQLGSLVQSLSSRLQNMESVSLEASSTAVASEATPHIPLEVRYKLPSSTASAVQASQGYGSDLDKSSRPVQISSEKAPLGGHRAIEIGDFSPVSGSTLDHLYIVATTDVSRSVSEEESCTTRGSPLTSLLLKDDQPTPAETFFTLSAPQDADLCVSARTQQSHKLSDRSIWMASLQRPIMPILDRSLTLLEIEYRLDLMRQEVLEGRSDRIYVPSRAKRNPGAFNEESLPLMPTVVDFLESKRRVFLLLGGTGSGKSAFCRQFLLELWSDYKQGGKIPIYIDLREIERAQDDLIATRLQEYGFSDTNCRELLMRRQVVLICDGYDESRLTTSLYTKKLCQLDVKMIITCRNTYLGRDYQGRFHPFGDDNYDNKSSELFEEATIVPFSESNIQDYVKQHISDRPVQVASNNLVVPSYDDIWKKLSSIPNLMNLVSNPFLLSLALEVLPSLSVDLLDPVTNKATRLWLFDRFVEEWILSNISRLHQSNLSQKSRFVFNSLLNDGFSWCVKDFSKRLAEAMYEHQRGRLVVKFSRRHNEPWKIEFFGSEIDSTLLREASLLSRDGILHWFIHKSLFDYFLSLVLSDPDESDNDDFDSGGDDSHGGSGGDTFSNGGQEVSDNSGNNDRLPGVNGVSASSDGGSTGGSSDSFGGSSGSSGGSNNSSGGSSGSDGGNAGRNGGTTGGNNVSDGGSGGSGGSHGAPGNGDSSRHGKDGYRSKRKAITNKSRTSTSTDPFSKWNLLEVPDVLEFLVERARSDTCLKKRLLSTIEQAKLSLVPSLAAANAITVLVKIGENIDSLNLDGVRVPSDYVSESYKELVKLSGAHVADAAVHAVLMRYVGPAEVPLSAMLAQTTSTVTSKTSGFADSAPLLNLLRASRNSQSSLVRAMDLGSESCSLFTSPKSESTSLNSCEQIRVDALLRVTREQDPMRSPFVSVLPPFISDDHHESTPQDLDMEVDADESVPENLDMDIDIGPTLHCPGLVDGSYQQRPKVQLSVLPPASLLSPLVESMTNIENILRALRMQRLGEYEQSVYIPPMAKASLQFPDDSSFSLMRTVKAFLASNRQVMLILGDSGSGKSTFNRFLEYELWQGYKVGGRIPLFINLPALENPERELIAELLRTYKFSETQIQELEQHRQFTLICDGYDESQLTSNLHTTNLLNRSGQWDVKLIITCRTQYLEPDYRSRFAPSVEGKYTRNINDLFQEAVIAPFSKEQIKDYVDCYVTFEPRPWHIEDYMDKLTTIPDLLDLVKNPFLLILALETLPNVVQDKADLSRLQVIRVQLYDTFVQEWLSVNKRRLQCNRLDRESHFSFERYLEDGFELNGIRFQQDLAAAIFREQGGRPVVEYTQTRDQPSWKAAFFGTSPEISLLRGASLLNRVGTQHRFVHRSILEYFFSCTIYGPADSKDDFAPHPHFDTKNTGNHPLSLKNLVTELSIIQFLAGRVQSSPEFKQQLLAVIEQSKLDSSAAIAAANAITILVRAGVHFNGANLQGVKISGADLSEGQFDSAQFQGADLKGVNFSRSWLRQADLSNAQMEGVQFGELPYLEMDSGVMACAYSSDGTMLAVGLWDDGIDVHNTTTWTRVFQVRRINSVCSVAFSPDNKQIVFGGGNYKIQLLDCSSGVVSLVMEGHTRRIFSVAFSPCGNQVASASKDKTVRLWDSHTGGCLFVLEGHLEPVTSVAYYPDGRQLMSGSKDGTVRVWNPETGNPGIVLRLSAGHVHSLAYSPDGRYLASGDQYGDIQLWDVVLGASGQALHHHSDATTGIAFSPNGQRIACSSRDGTVRLWDVQTGIIDTTLKGHSGFVTSVAFSPDGCQIASGSDDKTVRLWESGSIRSNQGIQGHDKPTWRAVYFADGRTVLSHTGDGNLQQWDSLTGEALSFSTLVPKPQSIKAVALSPDGRQIAYGTPEGSIQLCDQRTWEAERLLRIHSSQVFCIAYSPCGQWIASAGMDNTVRLWNLHDTEQEHVLTGTTASIGAVSFSPDCRHLAVGYYDGTIRLIDPRTKALLKSVSLKWGRIRALAHSPHSQQVALGSDSAVYLWDLQAETPCVTLSVHDGGANAVVYSPCGEWIASGGNDKTVQLWRRSSKQTEVESWSCVSVVRGFFGAIRDVSWSPSSTEFVTACEDGSVRAWRVLSDDDRIAIELLWSTSVGALNGERLKLRNVLGLSPIKKMLLTQRGAVDCDLDGLRSRRSGR